MTRDELIAALEAATGPSRELDCRIVALTDDPKVMIDPGGYRGERPAAYEPLSSVIAGGFEDWDGLALNVGAPRYTESIDAALMLKPASSWLTLRIPAGIGVDRMSDAGRGCGAYLDLDYVPWCVGGCSLTPAIALCIAAIKARQS